MSKTIAVDPFKMSSLSARMGCSRCAKKGMHRGHPGKRPHALAGEYFCWFFLSLSLSLALSLPFREAIPISYRALQDKLGDGSVIIPSRIHTRCRLRIRVALHFFLFFPHFFDSSFFIAFLSFFYRTQPSELNAQLRSLFPRCKLREKYTPVVIFAYFLSFSLSFSLTRVKLNSPSSSAVKI